MATSLTPLSVTLAVVAVACVGSLIVWAVVRYLGESQRAWARLAHDLGLEVGSDSWLGSRTMVGSFNQCQVKVVRGSESSLTSGGGSKSFTRVRSDLPVDLGLGLHITRELPGVSMEKLLGFQDIEVGDAEFDRRFIIKGKQAQRVAALLTSDLRRALIAYHDRYGLRLDDRTIESRLRGDLEREDLRALLAAQTDVVSAINRAYIAEIASR